MIFLTTKSMLFNFTQNIPEILDIYESEFNKLSERYFVEFPWPSADLVAPLVNKGRINEN